MREALCLVIEEQDILPEFRRYNWAIALKPEVLQAALDANIVLWRGRVIQSHGGQGLEGTPGQTLSLGGRVTLDNWRERQRRIGQPEEVND